MLRSTWSSRLLQTVLGQALRPRQTRSVKLADSLGSLVSVALVAAFVVSLVLIHRCSSNSGLPVWRIFICLSTCLVISLAVPTGEPESFSEGAPGRTMKEPPAKVPAMSF